MKRYEKWMVNNLPKTPAWIVVFNYYIRKVLPGYDFNRDYKKWVAWRTNLLLL